jgi:cobalt-zinc-cadmium efflux system protein
MTQDIHDHASSHDHEHHGHQHGLIHSHNHAKDAPTMILLLAVVLTLSFSGVEAFTGWWAKSLVLMSDAGHMATDALSLGVAAFAAWISTRPPSAKHSYGFGRAEVIGAWISSLLMVVIVAVIVMEAIQRLHAPHTVMAGPVMVVATIGLLLNLGIAWLFSHSKKTLNVRAAITHVLGDILGSIAALVSGIVIYFKGWTAIDPILSIFICVLILFSSLQLLRESLLVLMEGVPLHLDLKTVGLAMAKVDKVKSVHDLHIWTLSSGVIVLSAHIEINNLADWNTSFHGLKVLLAHQFGIDHITLQPETHLPIEQPAAFNR